MGEENNPSLQEYGAVYTVVECTYGKDYEE